MRGHGSQTDIENVKVDWSVLKRLWPYLQEFRSRVLLALGCLVAAKVASVGLPFVLKHIVDDLDQNGGAMERLSLALLFLIIAYGLLRFANVLFGELRDTLFGRVTERAMRRVGLKVFQHLHQLDIAFHLNRQTGGLSRDIDRGTNGISFLLRFMVFNIVPTFIEIGLVVVLLGVNYSAYYALLVLLAVVAYVAYSVWATEWRTRFVREANLAESRSNTRAIDSLLNFETVKYFTNESFEAQHYDKELAQWEIARRKNRLSLLALNSGQALIIAIAMTCALALAANDVVGERMTIGDFVLINTFMMQIFMPLNFLGFVYREMKGSMANIEAMLGLLEVEPAVKDVENAKPLRVSAGRIDWQSVSFAYRAERPIVRDLSFEVSPGESLAIVGASGAGKSTLVKLLLRLYELDQGRILIDGQDIRECTLASLRQHIAVVPQDAVLFNTSLLENVRYGRSDASDEAVWQAIKLARLDALVSQLPDKEHTRVGERGLKLSGGEKQRVAIARAILKDAPILLFDEATSSLDTQAERDIMQALRELARGHTTIQIAHRLSTVVDADRILVMDSGALVEQGDHASLMQSQGAYWRLWQAQAKQRDSSRDDEGHQ